MSDMSPAPLTRDDLAELLQHVHGGPMTAARKTIDGLLGTVAAALAEGREVHLHGFGRFVLGTQAGRSGTAPSGVQYDSPARRVVKFRPAKALADAVDAGA